jgi:hypothetical protein
MKQATNNKIDKSEFAEEAEASKQIAACAILNDKTHHGLFISLESAALAGLDYAGLEHNLITYVSARGDKVPGYLFSNPSFLLVRESPLLMRILANEDDKNGTVYKYDAGIYRQYKAITYGTGNKKRNKATTLSRWLIVLLNEDGRPLHTMPFRLPLGGRMSIALGKNYVYKLRQAFNHTFWQDATKTGSAKFNSLIINRPQFSLGQSPEVDQLVCVVGNPQAIDEDNYSDWFAGEDKAVKDMIFKIFEGTADFIEAEEYTGSRRDADSFSDNGSSEEVSEATLQANFKERVDRYNQHNPPSKSQASTTARQQPATQGAEPTWTDPLGEDEIPF